MKLFFWAGSNRFSAGQHQNRVNLTVQPIGWAHLGIVTFINEAQSHASGSWSVTEVPTAVLVMK